MKKYIVIGKYKDIGSFKFIMRTDENPWEEYVETYSTTFDTDVRIFEITQEIFKH